MNKKLIIIFSILIFLFIIQEKELKDRRKEYNKLQYNVEYNNKKRSSLKEKNDDLKINIDSFKDNLKDKIEEKDIWVNTKEKIEKALS